MTGPAVSADARSVSVARLAGGAGVLVVGVAPDELLVAGPDTVMPLPVDPFRALAPFEDALAGPLADDELNVGELKKVVAGVG